MPANIFANTGTSVSVLFIDKSNKDGDIMLVDASKLGKKIKEGKNQRTVLNEDEVKKIEKTFICQQVLDDFSVKVSYEQITSKNYSLSAGQYFEIKIEYIPITEEQFKSNMKKYKERLQHLFESGKSLEKSIIQELGDIHYE